MPASVPEPIATSELLVLNAVCTRTKEPIFRQVSVPGTYQKPAPYRLQTFTYSTGLAFTGRSAACAPATATRPAAEPRRRLFTIFICEPPVSLLLGGFRESAAAPRKVPLIPVTTRRFQSKTPSRATRGCPP